MGRFKITAKLNEVFRICILAAIATSFSMCVKSEKTQTPENDVRDYSKYKDVLAYFNERVDSAPQSPDPYYYRCVMHFEYFMYEEGIADCSKAIELGFTYPDVYLKRAIMYMKDGNLYPSQDDINKYLTYKPNDKEGQKLLILLIAFIELSKGNDKDKGMPTIMDIDFGSVEKHIERSNQLFSIGDEEGALSEITIAAMSFPLDSSDSGFNRKCNMLNEMKRTEKALEACNKAIEINPDNSNAYSNRGISYFDLGKYELAVKSYNKAIEINPEAIEFYVNRANAYTQLNMPDNAIADCDKAIKMDSGFINSYLNKAGAYGMKGDYKGVVEASSQGIKVNPKFPNFYFNRAFGNYELGEYEKAIEDLSMAIRLNPSSPNFYALRSRCYRMTGKNTEADKDEETMRKFN